MKNILYILFFFPIFSFSQGMKKSEIKKLIDESIKVNKSRLFNYDDLIFITDNTDSLFYKLNNIKVYTNYKYSKKHNFCRKLKLEFLNNRIVNFQDCQTCKEPTSCYVVTEKTMFSYKILEIENKIFLQFENKFQNCKFQITNEIRDAKNCIVEFDLIRN